MYKVCVLHACSNLGLVGGGGGGGLHEEFLARPVYIDPWRFWSFFRVLWNKLPFEKGLIEITSGGHASRERRTDTCSQYLWLFTVQNSRNSYYQ